ncbi:MAG TPA: hypothetical protein VFZ72_19910 [Jiangellaceae bacterium]
MAFPTLRGGPLRRANFRRRVWNPAVAETFAGTTSTTTGLWITPT